MNAFENNSCIVQLNSIFIECQLNDLSPSEI